MQLADSLLFARPGVVLRVACQPEAFNQDLTNQEITSVATFRIAGLLLVRNTVGVKEVVDGLLAERKAYVTI